MSYGDGLILDGHQFEQLLPLLEMREEIQRECFSPHVALDWVPWPMHEAYGGDGRWMVAPFALPESSLASFAGYDMDGNRRACPETWRCLRSLPQIFTAGFSMLEPGGQVWAHCDRKPAEPALRAHLVLATPGGVWLRMGDELMQCDADDFYVFDGRIDHQTANLSSSPRVVLLVDFALTAEQHRAHEAWFDDLRARDPQLFIPTPNRVVPH